MGKSNNCVQTVVDAKLCHGCGACYAVCPGNCITMHLGKQGIYEPVVDPDQCNHCGKCLKVCSGRGMDYDSVCSQLFDGMAFNSHIGFYNELLLTKTTDKNILEKASSGGLITTLLLHLLDTARIDAAIVARAKDGDAALNETVLATDQCMVLESSGSKYSPTATNAVMRSIIDDKSGKKYAYVGLPCQIASLRLLEMQVPGLTEKIVIRISLFCGKMSSVHGIRHILARNKLDISGTRELHYRKGHWPGVLSARDHAKSIEIPFFDYYGLFFMHGLFTPYRCLCCNDFHGDLSDLACGDAWLKDLKQNRNGKNLVIVKNKVAKEILDDMTEAGKIERSTATESMFEESYGNRNYVLKKDSLLSRLEYLDRRNLPVPEIIDSSLIYGPPLSRDKMNWLHSRFLNTRFFSIKGKIIPPVLLRLYYKSLDFAFGGF